MSNWKDAEFVGTLAAALAEAGDFEQAVTRQEEALTLLAKDARDRAGYEERLELYRAGKPYRQEPAAKSAAGVEENEGDAGHSSASGEARRGFQPVDLAP